VLDRLDLRFEGDPVLALPIRLAFWKELLARKAWNRFGHEGVERSILHTGHLSIRFTLERLLEREKLSQVDQLNCCDSLATMFSSENASANFNMRVRLGLLKPATKFCNQLLRQRRNNLWPLTLKIGFLQVPPLWVLGLTGLTLSSKTCAVAADKRIAQDAIAALFTNQSDKPAA